MTTQPTTFDELKTLIKLGRLGLDTRSPSDQFLYRAYIANVPDHLKDEILNSQITEMQEKHQIDTSGFTFNLFNYRQKLENLPLVKHCNLWFGDWNLDHLEIEKEIHKWIYRIYNQRLDFCFMVNPPEIRSIPTKPHAHVFINFENYIA
jgi:hypothetical protein